MVSNGYQNHHMEVSNGFHKWGTPIAGWLIMENPIEVDDD